MSHAYKNLFVLGRSGGGGGGGGGWGGRGKICLHVCTYISQLNVQVPEFLRKTILSI